MTRVIFSYESFCEYLVGENLLPLEKVTGKDTFYLYFEEPVSLYHYADFYCLQGVKFCKGGADFYIERLCDRDVNGQIVSYGNSLVYSLIENPFSYPAGAITCNLENSKSFKLFSEEEFFDYIKKQNLQLSNKL